MFALIVRIDNQRQKYNICNGLSYLHFVNFMENYIGLKIDSVCLHYIII